MFPLLIDNSASNLYQIIQAAGLTTGLKLCLDFGAASCYNPAVDAQQAFDLSGTGSNFFLGVDGSVQSSDPTFNGSAGGLSSNEYMLFASSDKMTHNGNKPQWAKDMIAASASWSMFYVVFIPSVASGVEFTIFATKEGFTTGNPGLSLIQFTDNTPWISTWDATNGRTNLNTLVAFNSNAWNVGGYSMTQNTGTTSISLLNGAVATNRPSNARTATDTTTTPPAFGAMQVMPAGTRIGMFAVWQGTKLTSANYTSLWNAVRTRYGL